MLVCSGSGLEYISGRKDFILGPRLEGGGGGDIKFSVLMKGEGGGEYFDKQFWGTEVFSIYFPNSRRPLVVTDDTYLICHIWILHWG